MHNWMRAEPIKVTIARLAKYGYKSIEISGEPEQFGLNGSKDTKKLLDDHGLKCWGSVTLMLGERNLVAADPGQRAKSVQYTKDCITMVKELDGYEMTIVPATVGKIVPDATPDEEWKWAVESMKEIYEHSIASKLISLIAQSKQWLSQRQLAQTAVYVLMHSISTSKKQIYTKQFAAQRVA
jgi:sugar phosphate isomerase/epimerase